VDNELLGQGTPATDIQCSQKGSETKMNQKISLVISAPFSFH